MRFNFKEFKADIDELFKDGYVVTVYVGKYRGRRYIPEISAVKRTDPFGMGCQGVSWDHGCGFSQRQMRKMESVIKTFPAKFWNIDELT